MSATQPADSSGKNSVPVKTTMFCVFLIALLFIGASLLQSNWYEYHVIAAGEEPSNLVNQNGWEPVPGSKTVTIGYAINYRRARFLPHADVPLPPVTPPAPVATSVPITFPTRVPTPVPAPTQPPKSATIHADAVMFTSYVRTLINDKPGNVTYANAYTAAENMYLTLSAEVELHTEDSAQVVAVRALLPPIKEALASLKNSLDDKDALVRLAVQLDHVS